jgi:peptidoglycan hydrolase CwlO-like protein
VAQLEQTLASRDALIAAHDADLAAARRTIASLRTEASALQDRMVTATKEEQQRVDKLHARFSHLMGRRVHHRASVDRQILDIIEVYEGKLASLQQVGRCN